MLLRFGVENHRSIQGYQELSLITSKLKDLDSGVIPVGESEHEPIFASAVTAIYGANASGKSTMLHALHFAVKQIIYSHSRNSESKGIATHPFALDSESKNKPSRYDLDVVIDGTRYHYGFILDSERIIQEWLYSIPLNAARRIKSVLFARDENDEGEPFYFGKSLKGENKQISRLVRKNSLFISAAAQNSHPQLSKIFDFFSSKFTERLNHSISAVTLAHQLRKYLSENEESRNKALNFLSQADIGVNGITFTITPIEDKTKQFAADFEQMMKKHVPAALDAPVLPAESVAAHLYHTGEGGEEYKISLNNESQGTISLLSLLGPIFDRLTNGGLLLLDELNSTLHPLVSRELIKMFASPESNPRGAQLIFTTHDTNLLNWGLLRRDQIWLAEKNDKGSSHFYSMAEIKVRASDNLEKGYLTGRFGAVPFIGVHAMEDFLPA